MLALLAVVVLTGVNAGGGFKTLWDAGSDNDSMLRMVEVRDLIGGQGWFDLHQYRMGPPGDFVMHWSRLVDAPIAAIILVGAGLTGSMAAGELAAALLWPTLLFAATIFFLLRAVRLFGAGDAQLPVVVLGTATLHYTGIFAPRALDHHNVQVMLTMATVWLLLDASARNSVRPAAFAGACAALSLAVAMEAIPYVAASGLVVALWLLCAPTASWRVAAGFGAAFGCVAAVAFVVTVPSSGWLAAQCDAYSLPQFAEAMLSGFGLAAVAASTAVRASFPRRAIALLGLGVLVAGVMIAFFPQCLADPYSGVSARLKDWWLDAVAEAQPLWSVAATEPQMAAGNYLTPLVALVVLAIAIARQGIDRRQVLIAVFLLIAVAVSIWQVRGARFSLVLAVIPLSVMVAGWRRRAIENPSPVTTLKMAGAWLVSVPIVFAAAVFGMEMVFQPTKAASATAEAAECTVERDYAELAGLPATNVLGSSNLGSLILRFTHHRALAGPYHRNIAGNLAALDAFTGPIKDSEGIARANGMTLVAVCRGNAESMVFARRAPGGLMAALMEGRAPAWLQIVPGSAGKPLELYRVLP